MLRAERAKGWHDPITDDEFEEMLDYLEQRGQGWKRYPILAGKIQKWEPRPDGFTPLHFMVHLVNSDKLVHALIHEGADVNAQDDMGRTPLHYSVKPKWNNSGTLGAEQKRIQATKDLLEAGANPNIKDRLGYTPLMIAVYYGAESAQVEILLEYGANPDLKKNMGINPKIATNITINMFKKKLNTAINMTDDDDDDDEQELPHLVHATYDPYSPPNQFGFIDPAWKSRFETILNLYTRYMILFLSLIHI